MDIVTRSYILLILLFSSFSLAVRGQVGTDYDLKKPPKFENRILASEKSNDGKKFRKSRRFLQNTVTHYNFYFNANNKLNQVLARAKAQNTDDYSKLLPFYNYSFDGTFAQKKELDSVIYKCTIGILIHDTRNDWIDNLYLLIGKAFFFRKDFDSAYITFQFLNYAFAPREKDGYALPIASNANEDIGGNSFMASTKENPNIAQKIFSLPPSRNESLVWLVRTHLAKNRFMEAASLIAVLKHDPQFPPRLVGDLEEVQALWFYKQSYWDSAAYHLERALPVAATHEEMARWEYLIAQLYDRAGKSFESKTFYERTVRHTYDPVLEVYARLNSIRQNKDTNDASFIQKNIDALVKMAHKDRYEPYRDIIYYTAAQIELERNNKPGAEAFLFQCIRSAAGLPFSSQKNKAFLQLANLSYDDKKYRPAKNYYDSVKMADLSLGDISWLPDRKIALSIVVSNMMILQRQDSLQRIADMPPAERDAYIKKLVKTLRRQQGLREEEQQDSLNPYFPVNSKTSVPDLFSTGADNADWYFYNSSLKAKGFSDFRTKWGNRPNVDNWQLSSLASQRINKNAERPLANSLDLAGVKAAVATKPVEISYKALLANLPLTPEVKKKSADSVEKALFALGKIYQEGLPDYPSAIGSYESLLQKVPDTRLREETLLNLYYCYTKTGDTANADRILQLLKKDYPNGKFTAIAINPDSANAAANSLKVNATHQYEMIYTAFIEGRFDEALAAKKAADSLYGDKYWTPQLLYIEAVYLIRSRQDPQAKTVLQSIMQKFPKDPMSQKAATLADVLSRRRQIETYLTNLKVTRVPDDSVVISPLQPAAPAANAQKGTPLVRNDSNMLVRKEDTAQLARAHVHLPSAQGAQGQHNIVPAGMDKLKTDPASLHQIKMDSGQLVSMHKQLDSMQAALVRAGLDSAQANLLRQRTDSMQTVLKKLQADTAQLAAKLRTLNSAFSLEPDKPHSVVIVLNKVDPVYVSEAKNAFNRYNLENYYSQSLTIENSSLSDTIKLVVIASFENSTAALEYLRNTKAMAPRAIVPWLPADKYSFLIISEANLGILMTNKDMPGYRKFLSAAFPGKF